MTTQESRWLMLVDDESSRVRALSSLAVREGWRFMVAETSTAALDMLASEEGLLVETVLFEGHLPFEAPCNFIRMVKDVRPEMRVLMVADSRSPILAVEALRAGASDLLVKPITPDKLSAALHSSGSLTVSHDELLPLSEEFPSVLEFDAMVGADANFRTALAQAATAARGHGHALIEGESGTGKQMLMCAMQHTSPRNKAATELVECTGLAQNTLETLLFGHEKGAFPGAFDRQEGALARCDGGTLLLSSVDALTSDLQDRLSAVIKTGIVRPTGAEHGFKIDVRILATSEKAMSLLVEDGNFSADLHEQLSGTRIAMPPLRRRMGDMPALSRHFLAQFAKIDGMKHHSIADSALSLLEAYDWPGNVRQLQNVLFRACVHEQREALTAHSFPHLNELLGNADRGESRARGLGVLLYQSDGNIRPLEEIEADIIRLAIGHYRGKMSEVARRLGIGRSTLYRKLNELGIDNVA